MSFGSIINLSVFSSSSLSGRSTVTLLFCQFTRLVVIQCFNLFSAFTSFMSFSSLIDVSVFSSSSLSQVIQLSLCCSVLQMFQLYVYSASQVFQLCIRSFRSFFFQSVRLCSLSVPCSQSVSRQPVSQSASQTVRSFRILIVSVQLYQFFRSFILFQSVSQSVIFKKVL